MSVFFIVTHLENLIIKRELYPISLNIILPHFVQISLSFTMDFAPSL